MYSFRLEWCFVFSFFFFKQKTAYEMRISDWSSDVCSSDLFLLRIFAAALRCDIRNRSFDDFQQRLLNAFAGNIASDRGAVALARDLIDLVDIDDALLRFFDVAVCGLQKFGDDALDRKSTRLNSSH